MSYVNDYDARNHYRTPDYDEPPAPVESAPVEPPVIAGFNDKDIEPPF